MPSKTATMVHEFAVEDLPLDRTPTLVPGLPMKDLPLAEHFDSDDDDICYYINYRGQRLIGISGSLICSKIVMELTFNPCGDLR